MMINKSMPKRIFAYKENSYEYDGQFSEHDPNNQNLIVAEYIRADLVESKFNEPLVHGQYRWVKHYDWPCWEMGKIIQQSPESDIVEVELENLIVDVDCLEKIGPVLHPPEQVVLNV